MDVGVAAMVLAATGTVGVATAWFLVRGPGASLWATMGVVFGLLGLLSLRSGWVRLTSRVDLAVALSVGVGAAVGLYALTAFFLVMSRRWSRLHRDVHVLYERGQGISLLGAVAVAAGVVAPGEELFWRGLVQETAIAWTGSLLGAGVAWGLSLAASAMSASVAVVLGTAVGGAAWATLALWSGGVAASVVCHASWTALMIARPPR